MQRVIPRAEWGARYAAGFGPAPLPATEVWLHHSATTPLADDHATVRQLEQIGQDRFGGGISYTFLITPAGRVFEGHGVGRRGAHTRGHNTQGRAICLAGNYETSPVTQPQIDAVRWLLAHGHGQRWWTAPRLTGGHRDVSPTACPGQRAYDLIPLLNTVEDDMDAVQDARLRRVERALEVLVKQVCGEAATIEQPFPSGWPTMRYNAPQEQLTMVMFLQRIDRQLNSVLDLTARPGGLSDDAWGHLLSLRAEVRAAMRPESGPEPLADQAVSHEAHRP